MCCFSPIRFSFKLVQNIKDVFAYFGGINLTVVNIVFPKRCMFIQLKLLVQGMGQAVTRFDNKMETDI